MSVLKFGFTAQEIIKEGRITTNEIQLLRAWLVENNLSVLNDEQIVIFLICCDKDQEMVKGVIKAFYYWRRKLPEIFNERELSNEGLRKCLNTIEISVMPKRTDDNCIIIVARIRDTYYKNFELAPFLKVLTMTAEAAIYDNPPDGLIFVLDSDGATIMHMTQFRPLLLRDLIAYVQEGVQMKVKSVYYINCNYVIHKSVMLVKPFIKSHLFQKMTFYTRNMNMEEFYKNCLPQKYLPENYGGFLPSMHILHEQNTKKMVDLEEHFRTEENQRNIITALI